MITELSYTSPIRYDIDEDGQYVKVVTSGEPFLMTNLELEEWADELKNLSNHMVELYKKNRINNG